MIMTDRINELNHLIKKEKNTESLISMYQELLENYLKKQLLDEMSDVLNKYFDLIEKKLPNYNLLFYYYQSGSYHFYLNQNEGALSDLLKALELCYQLDQSKFTGRILYLISGIYYRVKNSEKTIEYSEKALEIASEQKDYRQMITIYACVSRVYSDTDQADIALKYLEKAQKISDEQNIEDYRFSIYYNTAILYHNHLHQEDKALMYIDLAIDLAPQVDLGYSLGVKAAILNELKRYDECIQITENLLKECDEKNNQFFKRMLLYNLSDTYDRMNLHEKALRYLHQYIDIESEIHQKELHDSSEELKTRFELMYKEQEKELYRLKNIDLKNALKREKHLTKELSQKNIENERLLRILTQELANPLHAILMANQNIEKSVTVSRDLQDNLSTIKSMSYSMLNTLTHVKELLAVESGKIKIELKSTSVAKIMDETKMLFQNKLNKKNIRIQISADIPLDELYIHVEPVSFQNCVVNNLISNAIKFSFSDSVIQISLSIEDEWLKVKISDQGIGIKKAHLKKIFKHDKPILTSGTMGESGIGIGMPLIDKYLKQYNAKIHISSRHIDEHPNDHGTCVDIYLKRALCPN